MLTVSGLPISLEFFVMLMKSIQDALAQESKAYAWYQRSRTIGIWPIISEYRENIEEVRGLSEVNGLVAILVEEGLVWSGKVCGMYGEAAYKALLAIARDANDKPAYDAARAAVILLFSTCAPEHQIAFPWGRLERPDDILGAVA